MTEYHSTAWEQGQFVKAALGYSKAYPFLFCSPLLLLCFHVFSSYEWSPAQRNCISFVLCTEWGVLGKQRMCSDAVSYWMRMRSSIKASQALRGGGLGHLIILVTFI